MSASWTKDIDDVGTVIASSYSSDYSTNFTQSDLIGTGRVLGKVYSYAGRRLEKVIDVVAQRIGIGRKTNAIYRKIQNMYQAGWTTDKKKRLRICELCFTLLEYALAGSSIAMQRIGDLFSTTSDFYLWMVILDKNEFLFRVKALQNSTLAVPSSAGAYRTICERTRQILEAHTYGMTFLTINRAQLFWIKGGFMIDWKFLRRTSLSEDDMSDWTAAAGQLASNVRELDVSALSLRYLQIGTTQMEGASFYTELASQAASAVLESLSSCKRLSSGEIGARCGELASLLMGFYVNLSVADEREEAIVAVNGAMMICEELVATYPNAFNPTLTQSLRDLPIHLDRIGMKDEAVRVSQIAVDIHKKLADAHPDTTFEFALVETLYTSSNCLRGAQRRKEALEVMEETVKLCGRLLQKRPAVPIANPAGLVDSIFTYVGCTEGNPQESVFVQQSVQILKRVAVEFSPTYNLTLAQSLRILSDCLINNGKSEDAIDSTREAADIYRALLDESHQECVKELVATLRSLSGQLFEVGRVHEAIAAIKESVDVLRNSDPHSLEIPALMASMSQHLNKVEKQGDVLAIALEVVETCRELRKGNISGSNLALAQALNNLCDHHTIARNWGEALKAIREAVDLDASEPFRLALRRALYNSFTHYRRKTWWDDPFNAMRGTPMETPDIYSADLDKALQDVFEHYKSAGKWDEALDLMRAAAERRPNIYSSKLELALRDAFDYHKGKGWWGREKALVVMREAACRYPDKYNSELDQALRDAYRYYKSKGWWGWDKALDVMREGARRNPDVFGPLLQKALRDCARAREFI